MVDTVEDLEKTIQELEIPQLDPREDLDVLKITLKKVLNQIPSEERLSQIGGQALRHRVDEKIKKYKGGYKVIERVKENVTTLKREQQKIYYIAS